MEKRAGLGSGVDDLLFAFTVVSGAVVAYDILFRGKTAIQAAERHNATAAKLDTIKEELAKLNAKLAGK